MEDFLRGIEVTKIRPAKSIAQMKAAADPKVFYRAKFVQGVSEMLEFAKEEAAGKTPVKYKTVKGVKTDTPQRLIKWYFKNEDTWYTVIRYGTKALEFTGGDTLTVGKKLSDIVALYKTVIEAAEAGKLDTHLSKARVRVRKGEDGDLAGDDLEHVEPQVTSNRRMVTPIPKQRRRAA